MKLGMAYLFFVETIIAATVTQSFQERLIEWNIEQWVIDQIEEEFSPWEISGITAEQLASVEQLHGIAGRFTFINGVFSTTAYPAAWASELKLLLETLDKLWGLPDLDFLICANSDGFIGAVDWPSLKKRAPILSPASVDTIDGVISFIDHTIQPKEWGRDQWGFFTMIERIDMPWEDKLNLAYWRGVISDCLDVHMNDWLTVETWGTTPRSQLCDYSLTHPDIVDAKHTGWSGERKPSPDLDALHPPSPWTPYPPQLRYKYLISADGYTTTYPGYQWRLFSNSVTLKATSHKYSWFYRGLQPWVHYVPVAHDFSNLEEMVTWCRDHDDLCKQIASHATAFMKKYQSPEMYFKYAYLVLLKYAELLSKPIA
ncbi:MAG: hypothetical protein KBC64_01845 [Simkaniaceae bacterium]|nr:hypothetical protein [Simkaniaceae bacterium]